MFQEYTGKEAEAKLGFQTPNQASNKVVLLLRLTHTHTHFTGKYYKHF